jgi:ELWxxDGT repeat protein
MKISKVLFSAVLLAAMLLSLVAPALPGSASPNGVFTLKGTIRDLQDNSIADVVITVGSAAGLTDIGSTTTDANGNFSIANLPNGYVYLGLSKAGYVFSDTNGNIIDNDYGVPNYNSSIPEIDLNYIWPYNPLAWVPHSISGKVWNGNAVSPVGYESVRVRLYDYNAPFSWYDSVYTDANGAFTFTGIPDGEYIIYISSLPSGYITRSQYFYPTVNGSDLIDQNFVLTQVFAISGTITDGTNPIGNVTVATGGGLTATTDSSGAYSFTDLPAATYTLTAHKAGYSFTGPLTAEVTTADLTGQDFTGTQVLFNITGSVTVGGQPLVGALIDAGGGYVATTGADGAYALELLPAGSYTLTPSKLGYTITPLTLSAAVTTANVTGKDFTAAVDLPAPDPMPNEPVEINVNSVPNGGSGPNGYAEFNGKLYFRANDGMVGTELWSYDPSSGKSALVKDIYTGLNNNSDPNNSNPSGFTLFNSQLYFSAQMNTDAGVFIWKTDGTTAGTTQVSTAQVTTWLDNTDNLLIPMNNKLLFMGNDTVSGSNKLWSLDAAGNFAIIPLSPAGDYTVKGWQNDFVVVYNSEVYFAASTAATGTALFKSDGVSVTLVKSFPDGAATPPVLSALTQIGANLFFTLRQTGSPFLSQVWKSDGTTAGTAVVANMPTIDASKTIAISFKNSVGGYYLFAVSDGNDGTYGASELWRTDGTTTALVKDYFVSGSSSVGPDPGWSIIYNGFLYFRATDATSGIELWKTDGTTANTVLVKDINPGSGSNYISEFAIYTGALYFAADDGVNGTQLWKTDGSGAGTVMAAELNPNGGYPGGYYVSGGKLYFYANHPLFDQEMWSYDSTSASAALVADINQVDNGSNPAQFKELNGLLYFTATDNDTARNCGCTTPRPATSTSRKTSTPVRTTPESVI